MQVSLVLTSLLSLPRQNSNVNVTSKYCTGWIVGHITTWAQLFNDDVNVSLKFQTLITEIHVH